MEGKIQITAAGKIQVLRRREVIAKRCVLKAAKGQIKSIRLVLQTIPKPETTFRLIRAVDQHGNNLIRQSGKNEPVPPLPETSPAPKYPDRSGRGKSGSRSLEALIRKELMKKVRMTVNGKRKTVTMLDVIVQRLVHEASEGNIQAVDMLMKDFPDIRIEVLDLSPQFSTRVLKLLAKPVPEIDGDDS